MSTFKNFVQCRVTTPFTASADSIGLYAAVPPYTLPSEEGGLLVLTDSPSNPSKLEVISYSSRSALGLYGVTRGLEGTTALEWTGPVYCYQSLLAGEFKTLLDSKVAKVTGKQLSDENYTLTEKQKLGGVADEATKNRADSENAYKVHTHTVDQVPGLGYAATASTVGDGVDVMRAGAYGLGSDVGVDLPNGNADTLIHSGFYGCTAEWVGSPYSGVDGYNQGVLIHIPMGSAGTYAAQFFSQVQSHIFKFRYKNNNIWSDWADVNHTANILQSTGTSTDFPMSQAAISEAINDVIQNINDGSGPRPTKNHGNVAVAGSQTVTCDVQESDFHIMSMSTSNGTGTLTIDFSNMPDTLGKHFSWHVRLGRGARKTVAFAQTVNWAGGVTPTFTTATTGQDLMLFYKVDSETIRGMVIDAW